MTEPVKWTQTMWRTWSGSWSVSFEWTGISLDVFAVMTGIPLVDLSIEYEPWLVRGED